MLGCSTVPLGSPQALALRLLQCHLGVGMSSRLFVALREEQGLAYDVGVHQPARLGDAPFVFHLSSSSERAELAAEALLAEWQRLLETPSAVMNCSWPRPSSAARRPWGGKPAVNWRIAWPWCWVMAYRRISPIAA